MTRAAFLGWGTAVPEDVLTNFDLEKRVDTSNDWIVERTGIRERRIARPEQTTVTLGVEAGRAALKEANIAPDEIDMLVIATSTPEQPIPHTGAFVGEELGLHCASFDLNTACSGFVYGLVTATSLLSQPQIKNVLLIGSETLTRFINPDDRNTCILFGDGAGAVVLGSSPDDGPGVLAWDLGCDGSMAAMLQVPAGGSREPTTAKTIADGENFLQMQGQEVFRRAVRAVLESTEATLQRAELTASQIDWFVPHQANIRIIEAACERLGIPAEKTVVNIDRYGNTSAASVPLALAEAAEDGRIKSGDNVMMTGFGAGMTWGTVIAKWGQP